MALSLSILAFIEGIGGPEMGLILIIVLVMFGGKKLPEFARGLGKSMREFKKAASGVEQEFKRALEEEAPKPYEPIPTLPAASSTPELMPAADYHDDPYHHDSHYDHDGSEAGPASTVAAETSPTGVPALPDPSSAAGSPPAAELPVIEVPQADITPPVTPPAAPPSPPVSEPKP